MTIQQFAARNRGYRILTTKLGQSKITGAVVLYHKRAGKVMDAADWHGGSHGDCEKLEQWQTLIEHHKQLDDSGYVVV